MLSHKDCIQTNVLQTVTLAVRHSSPRITQQFISVHSIPFPAQIIAAIYAVVQMCRGDAEMKSWHFANVPPVVWRS